MRPSQAIKLAWGGLSIYLLLAFWMLLCGDHDNSLMFLCGSLLWVACIFIWHKAEKDEERS